MRALWFLLALIPGVVQADRLTTFAWDADPAWPTGTQVQLCANGVCTETEETTESLLVPVQPGGIITATAIAIDPGGNQSIPATLAQTWPLPPNGFWANRVAIGDPMAITPISGNVSIASSSSTTQAGSNSTTLTIPTGARFAVIGLGGWSSSGDVSYSGMTLNGNACTIAVDGVAGNGGYDAMLAWCSLSASDAGASKTLAWTQNIGLNEGGNVLVRFYDGVDAASPIRDSGYDADEGNPVTSTVSVSPSAGDLVIALGLSYTPDSDISWSGAGVSEIFERTANSVNTSWAESSSSGTVTVSATGSYPGLAVIVLKPAGSVSTITPNDINHSQAIDQPTLVQTNVLTTNDAGQSQAIDAATLTQAHLLAPSDLSHGQAIDVPSMTVSALISPADAAQTQTTGSPSLVQAHVIAIADIGQSNSIDVPVLTQDHILLTAGIEQSQLIEQATLVGNGSLNANDLQHDQSMGQAGVVQAHLLAPSEIGHYQSIDGATLIQANAIIPVGMEHVQILDSPLLIQAHVLTPADIVESQAMDVTTLAVLGSLQPDDLAHSQTLDGPGILQAHILTPIGIEQTQTIDVTTLTQGFMLLPYELVNSQTIDSLLLDISFGITPAKIDQSQTIGQATLIHAHVIVASDMRNTQTIDIAGVLSGRVALPSKRAVLIGRSDRYVIIRPSGRFILITKTTRTIN